MEIPTKTPPPFKLLKINDFLPLVEVVEVIF